MFSISGDSLKFSLVDGAPLRFLADSEDTPEAVAIIVEQLEFQNEFDTVNRQDTDTGDDAKMTMASPNTQRLLLAAGVQDWRPPDGIRIVDFQSPIALGGGQIDRNGWRRQYHLLVRSELPRSVFARRGLSDRSE